MPANGTEAATLSQIKEYVEYTQTQLEGYVDDTIASQPPPSADVDIDKVYPVGSIYMSMSATSPSALFGGTWQKIQNVFLLAAGSQYIAGSTGGEAEHTLTVKEMPSHNHSATFSIADGISFDNYYALVETRRVLSNKFQTITSDTGGNQPHNNMPPYLAVYMWQRTA